MRGTVGDERLTVTVQDLDGVPPGFDAGGDIGDPLHVGDHREEIGREWGRVAEVGNGTGLEVDASGGLLRDVTEAAAEAVAEDEGGDDEADGEDDAEGGEGKADLVGPEVLEGESQHGMVPFQLGVGGQLPSRSMWSSTVSGVGSNRSLVI